jgi:DNA-binding LytR/AlgR family response regulator
MKQIPEIQVGGRKSIAPTDIIMLKADVNYTHIFLRDGSIQLVATTLGKLEAKLQIYNFFRPNRSLIVNLDYVLSSTDNPKKIFLQNTEPIHISRRRERAYHKIIN